MKTAIIYYSKHHGNTKKLAEAIAARHPVTLIDAAQPAETDLSGYDLIGFASGIYYSKFHKTVTEFAKNHLPAGKRVFLLFTCGSQKDSYTKAMQDLIAAAGAEYAGAYGCLGYDTFGPFGLIGGIAKGHPDEADCGEAVSFYERLRKD